MLVSFMYFSKIAYLDILKYTNQTKYGNELNSDFGNVRNISGILLFYVYRFVYFFKYFFRKVFKKFFFFLNVWT
jgi:hypothetical protein